MSNGNGHRPPASPEAERSVLGCIMRKNDLLVEALKIVDKSDFYVFAHQLVWQTLVDLINEEGVPADVVTIAERLTDNQGIIDLGGFKYIAELWESAPAIDNIAHYANIVKERSHRRALQHTLNELNKAAQAPGVRSEEVLEEAHRRLLLLSHYGDKGNADPQTTDSDLDWQPFPMRTLPPVLRNYIEYAAESIMVDPGMMVLPVLCSVAGVIGNRWRAKIKSDWLEPCIFWGAVVARASSKKTPCFDAATSPIGILQEAFQAEFQAEEMSYADRMEQYKLALKSCESPEEKKALGKPPVKPTRRAILIDNITIETVLEILADNPGGLVLASDELAGFFGSFMKYRAASAGTDRPLWLRMFNAKRLGYDRKSGDRKSLFIRHACTSIVGMIQPSILANLFSDDAYQSGLAARFLLMYPPARPRVYSEVEIPHAVHSEYVRLCQALHEEFSDGIYSNTWVPRSVDMTAPAKERFIAFYNFWGKVQDNSDGEEEYALAKLEGYCPRFALLLAVVEARFTTEQPVIDEGHIERAETIVKWFARETCRVYELLRRGGNDSDDDVLLKWVRSKGGKVTVRDLQRSVHGKGLDPAAAKDKLSLLVASGKATWQSAPATARGGRPTSFLVLSPKYAPNDKTDKSQN